MLKKLILLAGFTLIALFLQVLLVPWMTIQDIRPDFILILVLFVGHLKGKMAGQLYGFGIGLLMDVLGMGSFLGLSALTKTVAGLSAGFLHSQKSRINPLGFYGINLLIIFLHFLILYLINFKGSDFSFEFILLRYMLPATIYSGVFYILIDYLFPID